MNWYVNFVNQPKLPVYSYFSSSSQVVELAKPMKGEKAEITVDDVKKHSKSVEDYKTLDGMHILHTILSRDLPPERFGAIINLILSTRPSASTEDIEDALVCDQLLFGQNLNLSKKNSTFRIFQRYFYGSGPYNNIPNITPLRKLCF